MLTRGFTLRGLSLLFSCSSPSTSSNTSINGNPAQVHKESNGKEMKESSSTNETEKTKKTKLDKQIKTSNSGNKVTSSSNKRPSDDDEILPKVKKKKKKIEESPQLAVKSTGFIPIEPPAAGEEEQHIMGNSKDVKMKIKSLPSSKTSKKPVKPPEKQLTDKPKDKKKDKLNNSSELNNSTTHSSNVDTNKKKAIISSKTKVKSPEETKPKVSKLEERKVEKLMFRRESGDSWSSSTSSNSPSLPILGNSIIGKNNALGALMAELSDQDYEDEEDVDISTPFQNDTLSSKLDSSLSNNNILNKKDNKSIKQKSKTTELKDKKGTKKTTSHSSKNGHRKSPTNASKIVESSKSSSKLKLV